MLVCFFRNFCLPLMMCCVPLNFDFVCFYRQMYMEYDLALYDRCQSAHFKLEEETELKIEAVSKRWSEIEAMAQKQKISA